MASHRPARPTATVILLIVAALIASTWWSRGATSPRVDRRFSGNLYLEGQLVRTNGHAVFATVDDMMRADWPLLTLNTNAMVECLGRMFPGDGGGGTFALSSDDSSTPTNRCTVFEAFPVGRWIRQAKLGEIDVRGCGAVGDGITDDTVALLSAAAATGEGKTLYAPPGFTFLITDTVAVTNDRVRVNFSGSTLKNGAASRKAALRVGPTPIALSGLDVALSSATNAATVPAGTFSARDMLLLWNSVETPPAYSRGQFAFADAASGTLLTMDRLPHTSQRITNAYRFPRAPIGVTVENVRVDLSTAGDGIGISAVGKSHVIENCEVAGTGDTGDPNYIGIEIRGQGIVARRNRVKGILDAGNSVDRAGYGILLTGDGNRAIENVVENCKHNLSTSERRAVSPFLAFEGNTLRNRADWEFLTDTNGSPLLMGNIDVHANVDSVRIAGNYCESWGRWNGSIRNGSFEVTGNTFVINTQTGLPFAQQQLDFDEAFITRGLVLGNRFVTPDGALVFYFGHRNSGHAGTHRNLQVSMNQFAGGIVGFADFSGSDHNLFEQLLILGNALERSSRMTPLVLNGLTRSTVVSGNAIAYGTNGNGITISYPGTNAWNREIFIAGNHFARDTNGTGFDIRQISGRTNIVELAQNRFDAGTQGFPGRVAVSATRPSTDPQQRIESSETELVFNAPAAASSPARIAWGGPATLMGSETEFLSYRMTGSDRSFSTSVPGHEVSRDFGIRADGLHEWADGTNAASILLGPRRPEDLQSGVLRLSGGLGLSERSQPVIPETSTATLWLEEADADKRVSVRWPDGSNTVLWHSGNDGAGSGLDADLLGGFAGSHFLVRSNHTGTQPFATIDGLGSMAAKGAPPTNSIRYAMQDGAWVSAENASTVGGYSAADLLGIAHDEYLPRTAGFSDPVTGMLVLTDAVRPGFALKSPTGTNSLEMLYFPATPEMILGRATTANPGTIYEPWLSIIGGGPSEQLTFFGDIGALGFLQSYNLFVGTNINTRTITINSSTAGDTNAPAAGQVKLFLRQSGGKGQLVAKFPTGADQVLATEP